LHIREYCELFKSQPCAPPTEARRRLGELQTIRAGIVAGLTEWKNRKNSGIIDAVGRCPCGASRGERVSCNEQPARRFESNTLAAATPQQLPSKSYDAGKSKRNFVIFWPSAV
jgi:hypothetical protein